VTSFEHGTGGMGRSAGGSWSPRGSDAQRPWYRCLPSGITWRSRAVPPDASEAMFRGLSGAGSQLLRLSGGPTLPRTHPHL